MRLRLILFRHRLAGRRCIHFLHIGKTGGTAVKTALKPYCVTSGHYIELHEHRTNLRWVPEGDSVVFFLRDPATRFASAFNSRKREGRPRFNQSWSDAERVAFSNFRTPDALASALSSGDDADRERAEYAMQSIQHLGTPFRYWLESVEYVQERQSDIILVGFQESLDEDFERLKRLLELPDDVALPEGDVEAHRTPAGFDVYLSETAGQNLRQWYQDDYRLFEFCRGMADYLPKK